MKIAGITSLILGLILGIMSLSSYISEANGTSTRISEGFDAIRNNDRATLDQMTSEAEERKTEQQHEALGCVICFIAGIAMYSRKG